jgi:hypothetical protein
MVGNSRRSDRHRKSEQTTCRFQAVGTSSTGPLKSTVRTGELKGGGVSSSVTHYGHYELNNSSQVSRAPGEWKQWARGLDSIFRLRLPSAGPCAIGLVTAGVVRDK